MPLLRLACHAPYRQLARHASIRMASTIVGRSGREYVPGEVLQRNHKDHNLSIFKAESGNESFVFKRVPEVFYNLSQHLAAEFAGSRRLRMHVDCSPEENILVYPFFRCTLLALIKEDPDFSAVERQKILRWVAEAIQELHDKDWIHIDVKPDNILVDWTVDQEGNKTVTNVALGDFDIAFKSVDGEPRQTPYAIGNAMWRSPEGQSGRGVTKASDMFSFGLVCIYTFGGESYLLLHNYQELVKNNIPPEQEILTRHFCFFGPATDGLFKRVDSETWRELLKESSDQSEQVVKDDPEVRFERWGADLGPAALDIMSGMTNPDPAARMTISQVLAHPWWQGDD